MADFMLTGDLDLSPAKKEVQEYIAFLRSETNKANTATQGTGAKVPTNNSAIQADKQRLDVQKKLIDAQARLVALKQQEATIAAKVVGKTVSKSDLGAIKTAGLKEIESAIPGMTPAQKGRFTKAINSQIASIEGQLKGLSGNDLQKAFAEIAGSVTARASDSRQSAQIQARATSQAEATQKASKKLDSDILEEKKKIVRKLAEQGKVLLFHGTAAKIEGDRIEPRQAQGARYRGSNVAYATSSAKTAAEYAEKSRIGRGAPQERKAIYALSAELEDFNNFLRAPADRNISEFDQASYQDKAASARGYDIIGKVTQEEALALQLEYERIVQGLKDQGSSVIRTVRWNQDLEKLTLETIAYQEAINKSKAKEVLKPDEVISPSRTQPKTDLVRYNDQDPVDVRSASEAEKRAHVQAYARERLRQQAEGTTGDKPIEAGAAKVDAQTLAAKEEELLAAREAARIEAAATAALRQQTAAQQAAEAQTTKAQQTQAAEASKIVPTPSGTGDYVKVQDAIPKGLEDEQALDRFIKEEKQEQLQAEKQVTAARQRKVRLAQAEADVLKNLLSTEKNPVGRVVGKDFLYDQSRSEEVEAYFANQKRISDQVGSTFGRGQERLGVASSKILDDTGIAIFEAKQEEATAARIAAKQEKNAAEKEQVEQGKQLAAEKKITQLKESYYTDYSSARVSPETGFITNLATRNDKRGQGEASKVMRQITDDADVLGKKLFLTARDELEGFYNQFGFKKTDQEAFGQPVYEREPLAKAQAEAEKKSLAEQKVEDTKQTAADKKITEAKTEQATAAKKLSAAQARAVNLVADGTAVTKEQLKEAGVKASTVRSLEKSGAVTQKPDGTLAASDAAIAAAKQTQLAAVQKQTATETQAAQAATVNLTKEAELAKLKEQLAAQIRKGIITTQEANTKYLNAGGVGTFNMKSAVPVSEVEPPPGEVKKERAPRRSRDQIINDEEGGLIEALRRKIKALNAQARVLENKLGPFTQAESLLIDALNRKARALLKQIQAIEAGQVIPVTEAKAPKQKVTAPTPAPLPAQAPPAPTGGGKIDEKELLDLLNDSTEATPIGEVKAEEELSAKERKEAAKAEKEAAKKKKEKARKSIEQDEAESARGLATKEYTSSSADAIAAEEAADAARIATATAQEKQALLERKAILESTTKREKPSTAQALATRSYLNTFDILGDETKNDRIEKILAGPSLDVDYLNKDRPKGFSAEDSFDEVEAGQQMLAAAYREYATLVNLSASQYFEEFLDFKAAIAALRTRMSGLISLNTLDDPYFDDIVRGKAETKTANTVIGAGVQGELLSSDLTQQYVQARLELIGYTKAESAMIARMLADDPAKLKAEAENLTATNKLTAATLRRIRDIQGGIGSQADVLVQRKINRELARQEAFLDPQYLQAERLGEINNLRSRRARAGKPESGFGKITQALGYDRSGGGSLTEFFGGGALSSLRYGLPSMLLYGAGSGIMDTIREAEELQYNLSRLEGQFNATFSGQDFSPVRQEILNVAKDTGLAADEIANLQIQITGAFGRGVKINGLKGEDLVKSQVESAAKLAQTVGLPLAEITDGLTAASLAFNASFEEIGDVALALEQESGVLAKETVAFIGDIAPVAKEAGYSLEEFSAIAAVAQQRSGRSGAALAESFGRVIPALTEQKDKLLELSAIEPALANDKFMDAIRQSNPKEILDQIGQAYANMSKEGQQATVSLLGGRREAQAIIPAIANQALVSRYVKDAELSAGTLEERFLKVQETLTNSLQRLGEAVRQLGVELLESGLGDVFDKAITGAKALLALISPMIRFVGALNEGLGGIPVSLLLAVGAFKLLDRAMTKVPLDPRTGLPRVLENGQLAPRERRFNGNALRDRETFTPRIVQDYRNRREGSMGLPALPFTLASPEGNIYNQTAPQTRRQALLGSARTSGKNFVSAFDISGAGSLAAGGTFLGITALASLYGWANGEIDKQKAELDKLNQEIEEGNSEVDFDIKGARENRVEELRAQAEEAREALGSWDRFWSSIGDVLSEEDLLIAQANALDTTEGFREAEKVLSESTSLRSDIFKDFAPKLGKSTGGLRDIMASWNDYQDAVIREIDGELKLVQESTGEEYATRSLKGADFEYVKGLADTLEMPVTELDPGFIEATLQRDSSSEILKLAQGEQEQIDKYGVEGQKTAQAFVELIFGVAAGSSDYAAEIDEILNGLNEIDPVEESKLNVQELTAAFDLGLIGIDEYAKRLGLQLEVLQRQIASGDETAATELQLLQLEQQKAELEKALGDAIVGRQENLRKIAEALGASEQDLNTATVEVGLQNLNNPTLTDNNTRLQIALDIVEAQKSLDLKLAYQSGNIAEVERIYREGVRLSPEVRATFFTSSLETNDVWQALLNDYEASVDSFIAAMTGTDFGEGVDSALASAAQAKAKNTFGDIDGEALAETVFKEVFDDVEGISDSLSSSLSDKASSFAAQLNDKGLSDTERQALENSLAFVIALMNFAGLGTDAIAAAIGTVPNTDIPGLILGNTGTNNPLGTPPPATAKPQETEEQKTAAVEAAFSVREARANRDSLLLAKIEKEKAAFQLSQAKEGEFDSILEQQAAIFEAEAAGIRAQQSEVDALKALSDARFEFMKAVAQVNGDLIQVAQLEVQRLQADLALARSTGDPNADAIAGQLLLAQDQLRKDLVESRSLDFDLFATYLEAQGDVAAAALTRVKQAQFTLDNARGPDEQRQAMIELINAQKAYKQAQQQEREAVLGLKVAQESGEDPVAQARLALQLAKENLAQAQGVTDKANAQKAVLDAQNQLEDAMANARLSMFSLRQAELTAMDDQIGAAQVAVEIARQQLNDAISQGQGAAAINNARAGLISAEKQLADTMINEKLDEYKWLLDMGQITQGQYVKYLESLQSTLAPGSKQFKDLALTIKQLKDGIQGDLQANLPTSFTLPTLYEVRRFDQTPQAGAGFNGGIGYQDNRQVSVTVEINEATSAQDTAGIVLKTLETALGTGRNGYGVRRI